MPCSRNQIQMQELRKNSSTRRDAARCPRSSAVTNRRSKNNLRREFVAWRKSLPTALERDTLLMPEAIADSVVAEVSRFLDIDLPVDFRERLAAKAHRLYPRHSHFRKVLQRPGNTGRDMLRMYMRHWLAAWLKRERKDIFPRLPRDFALGR